MSSCLPSTFESITTWLQALNMAKYVPAFEAAGVTSLAALRQVTDAMLKEAGVTLAGHRKRLLLGVIALGEGGVPPPPPLNTDAAPFRAARPRGARPASPGGSGEPCLTCRHVH